MFLHCTLYKLHFSQVKTSQSILADRTTGGWREFVTTNTSYYTFTTCLSYTRCTVPPIGGP